MIKINQIKWSGKANQIDWKINLIRRQIKNRSVVKWFKRRSNKLDWNRIKWDEKNNRKLNLIRFAINLIQNKWNKLTYLSKRSNKLYRKSFR